MVKTKKPVFTPNRIFNWIISPLFFIGFYLYFILKIQPELIYQLQEPIFYLNQRFLIEFLKYPGGLTDYLSNYLSQSFFIPWLGALVITLIAIIMTLCFKRIIQVTLPDWKTGPVILYPAIALLILHSHYEYHLTYSVGLMIALLCTVFYIRISSASIIIRLPIFTGVIIFLYLFTGGLFLLFLIMSILYECQMGRCKTGLSMLVLLIMPYLSAKFLYLITVQYAYFNHLFFEYQHPFLQTILLSLYLVFPIIPIGLILLNRLDGNLFSGNSNKSIWIKMASHLFIQFIFLFIVTTLSVNPIQKKSLLIDYYARRQMWPQVIETSKLMGRKFDWPILYQINRALYHTSQLSSEMFSFPQIWGSKDLILSNDQGFQCPLQFSDLFFDLGHINEAEHWAHESMSIRGETCWTLERLSLVNLAKGEYDAAHVFTSKLKQSPLFKKRGCELAELVENPRKRLKNREFIKLRSRMLHPVPDFIYYSNIPDLTLHRILNNRPDNRMAYEYLMAYYLLTGKLNMFLKELDYLQTFGYKIIPRHFEEAVILYKALGGEKNIPLPEGYGILKKTINRFQNFNKILSKYHGSMAAAKNELEKQHGNTYWFYAMYLKPKEPSND